jgi:endogenous inhibitor of DNA gyrase (YacG/DUF329 family)
MRPFMTERKRDVPTGSSSGGAASGSTDRAASGSVGGKCPICGKPTVHAVRPFCSRRCADIDLGRWVSGDYVIAGGVSDADEDGDEGFAKEAGRLDRGTLPDDEPR